MLCPSFVIGDLIYRLDTVYKRLVSVLIIERKFFVFIGILDKGDSDAL